MSLMNGGLEKGIRQDWVLVQHSRLIDWLRALLVKQCIFSAFLILRKALQASLTLHLKYFWLCLQRIIVYSDDRDWSWCIRAVSAPAVDHLEYVIFSNRILKRPILLWLHYWTPLLLSIYITNQVNMRRAGGCK